MGNDGYYWWEGLGVFRARRALKAAEGASKVVERVPEPYDDASKAVEGLTGGLDDLKSS